MNCTQCPRKCNIDRNTSHGFCGEGDKMRISRAALHYWEEPCISATRGSGTVFFTGCNLRCIFCQNAAISENGNGREITPSELCEIFFDLKNQGAHNINLVTPSHFVQQIREAILLAKERGFDLPFVYNSSAYETPETLRILDGLIDVYLPDFKYMNEEMAANYSHAKDYPLVAKEAIAEMFRQVGDPVFVQNDSDYEDPFPETKSTDSLSSDSETVPVNNSLFLIKRGVIVRHLVLPLGVKNACAVIDYLSETYGDRVYISVMSQYTPLYDVPGALSPAQKKRLAPFPELHRKVTKREYNKVLDYCLEKSLNNVFIQEGDVASESFIPPFGN